MQQSFLQSEEWEEFQKSVGRKTWRIDGTLLLKHDLPFGFTPLESLHRFYKFISETKLLCGLLPKISASQNFLTGFNYLYCPRPKLVTNNWLLEAKAIARRENSIFLKIDPAENFSLSLVACRLSQSIQPRKTIILDLRRSEDKILSQMREKTRYNIRLSERRGVVVGEESGPFSFDSFWELLKETADRDGFYTHEKTYYKKLLLARSESFSNKLFFAKRGGETLAAAMINFYGDTATYLHGASSRKNKELMAPHLLHLRIIQEAKKRGLGQYDFGGIDEKKWPGVTRFKIGFGGSVVEYPPSVDIIYKPILYKIYRLARKFI